MERLTHERVNGIKTGYWSAATKEVLVQKLAAYENTDSNAGMLAHGNYCQTIYSPILTASALRWEKTRLAAAP